MERTGKLAVRTQDYLRANMGVTFYVCISPNKEDVLVAAARLSKQGRISENDIKEALEKRADDAIRAAAKRKSIAEIDSDKLGNYHATSIKNYIFILLKYASSSDKSFIIRSYDIDASVSKNAQEK